MVKLKDMPRSLAYDVKDLRRSKKRFSHRNRARDPKTYRSVLLLNMESIKSQETIKSSGKDA